MKIVLLFILFVIFCLNNSMGTAIADTLNGQGAVCFSDGSKYVGQFKDGIIHGQGTIDFPDGSKYSGDFFASEMNGLGTMIFPDGSKYVGQFKDGKIHGKGHLSFPDGSMYEGEFEGDKYHGQGKWNSPHGIGYEGQFKNGKFDGQGVYSLPDGSRYVGLFRDDHFHGHGAWDKGGNSGGTSSAEQLTWKETGPDRSVENADIMNESFTEMEEQGADPVVGHEESIQQKIEQEPGSDAYMENHSLSGGNLPPGDSQQEEKYPAVTIETSNQKTSVVSASSMEDREMISGESNTAPGPMASVTDSYPSSQLGFSVQVGAFLSRKNAERLTHLLIEKGYSASMLPMLDCIDRPWYAVRIGSYSSLPEAKERAISFTEKEQMMATVRPVDSL